MTNKFKCTKCGKPHASERGKKMHELYCGDEERKKKLAEQIKAGKARARKPGRKKKAAVKKSTRKAAPGPKIKHTYRARGNKTRTENLTPLRAIFRFCQECNGFGDDDMIKTCETAICPLHPFRMKGK